MTTASTFRYRLPPTMLPSYLPMSRMRPVPSLRVRRRQHWSNSMAISKRSKRRGPQKVRNIFESLPAEYSGLSNEAVFATLSAEDIALLVTSPDLARRLSQFALLTKSEQSTFLSFARQISDSNGKNEYGNGT